MHLLNTFLPLASYPRKRFNELAMNWGVQIAGFLDSYISALHLQENDPSGNFNPAYASHLHSKITCYSTHWYSYLISMMSVDSYNILIAPDTGLDNIRWTYLPANDMIAILGEMDLIVQAYILAGAPANPLGVEWNNVKKTLAEDHLDPILRVIFGSYFEDAFFGSLQYYAMINSYQGEIPPYIP